MFFFFVARNRPNTAHHCGSDAKTLQRRNYIGLLLYMVICCCVKLCMHVYMVVNATFLFFFTVFRTAVLFLFFFVLATSDSRCYSAFCCCLEVSLSVAPWGFYIPSLSIFRTYFLFFFLLLLLAGMCVLCIHAPYVPYTYTKGKARRFSGNDADCCCSTLLLLLLLLFLTRLPCTFEVLKLTAFFFFSRLCLQARMFFYTTLPNNVFFFFSFFYTLNYSEQRDILTLQVFLCVFFFFFPSAYTSLSFSISYQKPLVIFVFNDQLDGE